MYAIRMAVRQFRHHPLFSLLTVIVLGLGTGAAITVYTVVDAVVLRPLPYRAPDRLLALWDSNSEKGLPHEPLSPVTFLDYRALHAFQDAAAWWRPDENLVDPGLDPLRVNTVEASANLFEVLGVSPQLGAGFPKNGPFFSPEPAVVISARLWRGRYHGDPSIIGRRLTLNGGAYTVLGVMPDGFDYPGDIDVWQRLMWDLTQHVRGAHFMEAVARLGPGVDLTEARNEANALAGRLGRQFAGGWAYQLVPLLDDQLGYYRPALLVMFGAVGLLLLIGCLNVASLLLARALARNREISVRTALGATRRQIGTQLVAESLVLSVAGILAGLVVAALAVPVIVAFVPVSIPRLSGAVMSGRVIAFAVGVAAITTVIFGLVPSFVLLRRHVASHLREGDRGTSRGSQWVYRGLVACEVGLACALLVGSALLVRTVRQMTQVPSGVSAGHVALASIQLSGSGDAYADWQKDANTEEALLDRIRQQPGVSAAGTTIRLPFETGWRSPFFANDVNPADSRDAPQAQLLDVSDGYFEAMGARLIAGRFFSARDTSHAQGVVVVNEAFARQYLAGRPAVDQRITPYAEGIGPLGFNLMVGKTPDGHPILAPLTVIGVVGDMPNAALGQPVEPAYYLPSAQFPFRSTSFAVAARDEATAVAAVRQALHEIAPTTPVGPTETWADRFGRRTAQPRVLMATLSAFGVLAAVLASLGVYGLFSWSVASRRRELAIRLTLGARPIGIGAIIVEQGAVLVLIGLVGGWLVVHSARGVLSTLLFHVSPDDAASTAVAAGVLTVASLAACLPAARRAMQVNPVEGLRSE